MSRTTGTGVDIHVEPKQVLETIGRHMLVDGFPIVVDLEKSQGMRLRDKADGRTYIDFFQFFASLPIGINHPKITDPAFRERIGHVGAQQALELGLLQPADGGVRRGDGPLRDSRRAAAHVPDRGRRARPSRTRSRPRSTGRCRRTSARGHQGRRPAGDPLPRGVPRSHRLHHVDDQHRPGEDQVLSQVQLAAHRQPEDHVPAREAPRRR